MKGTHGTAACLKRVVQLVTPAFTTRSSPCCWRHSLPPFYCLRATEPGAVLTTSIDASPTPHGRAFAGTRCGQERGTAPLRQCSPQGSFVNTIGGLEAPEGAGVGVSCGGVRWSETTGQSDLAMDDFATPMWFRPSLGRFCRNPVEAGHYASPDTYQQRDVLN